MHQATAHWEIIDFHYHELFFVFQIKEFYIFYIFLVIQKQIEIELRDEQVPTFQQIADYERNLELASTE